MIRRQAREAVLKALFAHDIGKMKPSRALDYVLSESPLPEAGAAFARELLMGVVQEQEDLDPIIDRYAVGWRVERMAAIDRNILRIALYEILHRPDIPAGVSVNEAVELAKRFGDTDSPKFINGILGQVVRHMSEPVTSG